LEQELRKRAGSLKARCDFAYASYLTLGIGFLASEIWSDWAIRHTPDNPKGNDFLVFALAHLLSLWLLLLPTVGMVAGAVAFPHIPALLLACLSFFGLLRAIAGEGQTLVRLTAISALGASLWWFIVGRKNIAKYK
jgi:hypothetical protein